MTSAIVGHSGFVGSNLVKRISEPLAKFNSRNIATIKGNAYDVLYISAIQAKKWWANQNEEEDRELIDKLFENLSTVGARKVVFISTVDVYDPPLDADESTFCGSEIHPYGKNRLYAEKRIKELFDDVHIIRLQGLVAGNLNKNIIFDLKQKNILETINPNSELQWYPLNRLSQDIKTTIELNLPLVNLSVEPLKTKQIIDIAPLSENERAVVSSKPASAVFYNVKSKHAGSFGGNNGYIVNAEESLNEIQRYFNS